MPGMVSASPNSPTPESHVADDCSERPARMGPIFFGEPLMACSIKVLPPPYGIYLRSLRNLEHLEYCFPRSRNVPSSSLLRM